MISEIKFLDSIDVAAPCSAPWQDMAGDDRVRFCQDCKRKVFNLSEMTRREAETLVRKNGAKGMCIRFYRRRDGTVLMDNCPVGLRAIRNMLMKRWAAVVSLAALFHLPGSAKAAPPPNPPKAFVMGRIAARLNKSYTGFLKSRAAMVTVHRTKANNHANGAKRAPRRHTR